MNAPSSQVVRGEAHATMHLSFGGWGQEPYLVARRTPCEGPDSPVEIKGGLFAGEVLMGE